MWRAVTWRGRAVMGAAAGAAAFALPTAYAKPLPSPTGQSPTSQVGGGRKERTESFNRADSFIDWQGAVDTDYVEALRALRLAYKLPLDMMRSLATHFKSEAVAGLAGQPSSVCHIGLEPPRTSRAQAGMLLTRARLVWGRCVCCPPL